MCVCVCACGLRACVRVCACVRASSYARAHTQNHDHLLQFPPFIIALAAIYLASWIKEKDLKSWFSDLNVEINEVRKFRNQLIVCICAVHLLSAKKSLYSEIYVYTYLVSMGLYFIKKHLCVLVSVRM